MQGAIQDIKDGKRLRDIADDHSAAFVKYHRGFAALRDALGSGERPLPVVWVFHGAPGTGKSRLAAEIAKHSQWQWSVAMGPWWDTYDGEECVIFNDFEGQIPFDTWKQLVDRYPYRVPVKGGYRWLTAKYFIFTSQKNPEDWWGGLPTQPDRQARDRRIHLTECFDTEADYPRVRARILGLDPAALLAAPPAPPAPVPAPAPAAEHAAEESDHLPDDLLDLPPHLVAEWVDKLLADA